MWEIAEGRAHGKVGCGWCAALSVGQKSAPPALWGAGGEAYEFGMCLSVSVSKPSDAPRPVCVVTDTG
jgi:hypothetical protein